MSTTRLQHTDATAFERLGVDMLLDGVPVRGFFSNAYFAQDLGGSGSAPACTLPSSAVPADVVGKPLLVNATTYKVVETMPDGTGITVLRLRT